MQTPNDLKCSAYLPPFSDGKTLNGRKPGYNALDHQVVVVQQRADSDGSLVKPCSDHHLPLHPHGKTAHPIQARTMNHFPTCLSNSFSKKPPKGSHNNILHHRPNHPGTQARHLPPRDDHTTLPNNNKRRLPCMPRVKPGPPFTRHQLRL